MILNFYRSHVLDVKIKKPGDPRAFVFDVQVGIGKASPQIDPLSGMLINLTEVDALLVELAEFWRLQSWNSLTELLEKSREFLDHRLGQKGVFLEDLCLREKRGFWLRWRRERELADAAGPTGTAAISAAVRMGREMIHEVGGQVLRLSWERDFDESILEKQELTGLTVQALSGSEIFKSNPDLRSLEVENLGSGERFVVRN